MQTELTKEQIRRQDDVDNAINRCIETILEDMAPKDGTTIYEYKWNIDVIGNVRDAIFEELKSHSYISEQQEQEFYPFLEEKSGPESEPEQPVKTEPHIIYLHMNNTSEYFDWMEENEIINPEDHDENLPKYWVLNSDKFTEYSLDAFCEAFNNDWITDQSYIAIIEVEPDNE